MKTWKSQDRMDLGLALLSRRCIPGVGLTEGDIAIWADVSRQRVQQIEAKALRKIRIALKHSTPEKRKLWDALMQELFERREPAGKRARE